MIPLIVIFMNLIMIHSQGVTFKDITQLNWRAPIDMYQFARCYNQTKDDI
jgi:hypothetical protein